MQLRSNCFGVLAALATAARALRLRRCRFVSPQAWFAKPIDVPGRNAGYTFSELQESKQRQRPITANDLVNSNGVLSRRRRCAQRPRCRAPGQAAESGRTAPDTAVVAWRRRRARHERMRRGVPRRAAELGPDRQESERRSHRGADLQQPARVPASIVSSAARSWKWIASQWRRRRRKRGKKKSAEVGQATARRKETRDIIRRPLRP